MNAQTRHLLFAGGVFVSALLIIFVWIPLDVESGLVERERRQFRVGDSLGPVVATCIIAIGAVLMVFERPTHHRIANTNLVWIVSVVGITVIAIVLMRYTGPAVSALFSDTGYRPVRNTAPWKYMGFVAGGSTLIFGMSALVTRRLRISWLLFSILGTIILAILYDLPFDDLLLPPNGDV